MSAEPSNENNDEPSAPKQRKLKRSSLCRNRDSLLNLTQGPINLPTVCGIIEKVKLKNFMCHANLEVDLGPNVNFIIGRNGSGKSAILTAIIIGLGGKASLTSRGASLRSFIKTGKTTCEISITLRNTGIDSYKEEIYGERIQIERKIVGDSSSYKLKDSSGKLVTTKRDELDRILLYFNVQINNPISVLNQEASKTFLSSSSPHDKFNFFMKATMLEKIRMDYVLATDQKEEATIRLKEKINYLPALQREVKESEKRYNALGSLDHLREKEKKISDELLWAVIIEDEQEVEKKKSQFQAEAGRSGRYDKKVSECDEKVSDFNKRFEETQKKIKQFADEMKKLAPGLDQHRSDFQTTKVMSRDAQKRVKRVQLEIADTEKEKTCLLDRIREIKTQSGATSEDEKRIREENIVNIQSALSMTEDQMRVTGHLKQQLDLAVQKGRDQLANIKSEEQAIKANLDRHRKYIANLQNSKKNSLQRYGHHVPQLLNLIEDSMKKGKFTKKPIGPLGIYIKLKDPSWAVGMEVALGRLLHSFICDNHADERELERLINVCDNSRRPPIITSKFLPKVHDFSKNRPRLNYPTLIDLLVIDEPCVANTLIDQRSVENIIMVADGPEATSVMDTPRPPVNIKEAFTKGGDRLFSRPTFRWYSSNKQRAEFLSTNVENEIQAAQNEIAILNRQLEELNTNRVTVENELRDNREENRRHEIQLQRLNTQLRNSQYELQTLQAIEDPEPVDVTTLEEEISVFDQQIDQLLQKKQLYVSELDSITERHTTTQQSLQQLQSDMSKITEEADPLRETLAKYSTEIEEAKKLRQYYNGKKKEHKQLVQTLEDEYKMAEAKVLKNIETLEATCERINTRRSKTSLKSELDSIKEHLEKEMHIRGDQEKITREYAEKLKSFKEIKAKIRQLQHFLKFLDSSMNIRLEKYDWLKNFLATRVKTLFIMHMLSRKFNGVLEISFPKKSLQIKIQPTYDHNEMTEIKSLSGGEKSFSTVCFILSLWQSSEPPFRCMDEFDVFMDMVNRGIALEMLTSLAELKNDRQFIFLTPLDMSRITLPESALVYRMKDPETNQPETNQLETNQQKAKKKRLQ